MTTMDSPAMPGSPRKAHRHAFQGAPRVVDLDAFDAPPPPPPPTGLDTPPPSSPAKYYAGDDAVRAHRSSSVTVPFSSSPIRSSSTSSPNPSCSPVKRAYKARPSFGLPRAANGNDLETDPHAGLFEVSEPPSSQVQATHVLYGSYTHALMIGRSKPTGAVHASSASSQDQEHCVQNAPGMGTKPTQHVPLPNKARHVSRRHAVVEWLPFAPLPRKGNDAKNQVTIGGFVVKILGQNGLIVEGKRRREGTIIRLEPGKSTIDFFGVKARFQVRPEARESFASTGLDPTSEKVVTARKQARASLPQSDGTSPVKRQAGPRKSLPSSSALSSHESEGAVSQLLGAVQQTQEVSAAKGPSNSGASMQLPPTPPPSSPVPLRFGERAGVSSPIPSSPVAAAMDTGEVPDIFDGADEPESPSLGRSRFEDRLPLLPAIKGNASRAEDIDEDGDVTLPLPPSSRNGPSLATDALELDDEDEDEEDSSDEEFLPPPKQPRREIAVSKQHTRQQQQQQPAKPVPTPSLLEDSDDLSDAESELTPSPTPGPAAPRKKSRVSEGATKDKKKTPKDDVRKASRTASPATTPAPSSAPRSRSGTPASAASSSSSSSSTSRGRPLTLTNSQMRMPPPKLPASALGKDSEKLRTMLRDHARECVALLAPTYDLEGLLAGAIVFHRTATISASEAVRSVLANNQGLMRGEVGSFQPREAQAQAQAGGRPLPQGEMVPGWGAETLLIEMGGLSRAAAAERWASIARRAWTEQLEIVLQSKRMFGQIQRAGKDASGNSLEHWYYYDKDGDEDAERATNLGALAKPIRGALKTHKPIFWKKSAYPRSADEEALAAALPTSSSSSSSSSSSAAAASSAAPSPLPGRDALESLSSDSQIGPAIISTPAPVVSLDGSGSGSGGASPTPTQMKIDENRIWEETQPEEVEKTWDRVGDLDWQNGKGSFVGIGSGNALAGKRKRR